MRWLVVSSLLASCGLTGCSTDDGSSSVLSATRVAIRPSAFLGEVSCSAEPGAMRSYVVTLLAWEDVDDSTPFTVGASYPTSCSRTVAFEDVVIPGTWYTAEVQGYEEPYDTLEPFGSASYGFASGSSTMLDRETEEVVTPRWSTRCGHSAADGAFAIDNHTRFITGCDPIDDSSPTPTAILFDPNVLLGSEACGSILQWSVLPDDPALAAAGAQSCDDVPVVYSDGIVAGESYGFYLTADSGDGVEGAECFAVARPGVTASPTCAALRPDGFVDLTLQGLLVDGQPVCPAEDGFDLLLDGGPLNDDPIGCNEQARIGPLAPGSYAIDVVVVDALGAPVGTQASCSADVEPGRVSRAACTP